VSVCSSCKIDVTGRGFLGGGSSGNPVYYGRTSNGLGGQQDNPNAQNGGSHGGQGGTYNAGGTRWNVYDNILNPSEPGAGGSTSNPGTGVGGERRGYCCN